MRLLLFILILPLYSWSQGDLNTISSYMKYLDDNSIYDYEKAGIDSVTIYKFSNEPYSEPGSRLFVKFYFDDHEISRMKYDFEPSLPLLGGKDSGKIFYNYYEVVKKGTDFEVAVPTRYCTSGSLIGYPNGLNSESKVCLYSNIRYKRKLIAKEEIVDEYKYFTLNRYYSCVVNVKSPFLQKDSYYVDTLYFKESESHYVNGELEYKLQYDYHIDSLKLENIIFPSKYLINKDKSIKSDSSSLQSYPFIEDNYTIGYEFLDSTLFENTLMIYSPYIKYPSFGKLKRKEYKKLTDYFTLYFPDFNSNVNIKAKYFDFYYENDQAVGLINTLSEKLISITNIDLNQKLEDGVGFIGFVFNDKYQLIKTVKGIEELRDYINSRY